MAETHDHAAVCAVVLAGGRATRMGGVDKGLQPFLGQPLVSHALKRLKDQSHGAPGLVAINANRNLETYGKFGVPVWPDLNSEFDGPLSGLQTAFLHCMSAGDTDHNFPTQIEFLLTVPCDSPLFPTDLLVRLHKALIDQRAEIAIAIAPEVQFDGSVALRPQPVFALLKTTLQASLRDYLSSGGRKIDTWFYQHTVARVAFDQTHDAAQAFANANTLEELRTLERL
jgi:molybdopterin-guanine dinucleotide biosynthesis protein A